MKKKISLAFAMLLICFVFEITNVISFFRSIPILFRGISPRGLLSFVLNSIRQLTVVGLLVMLYFHSKKDLKKVAVPVLFVMGAVAGYLAFPEIKMIINELISGGRFIDLLPRIASMIPGVMTALLLILGAIGILKGRTIKLGVVIAVLAGIAYFMFMAALFFNGMASITTMIIKLLLLVGLCVLPKTFIDRENAPMLNKGSVKALAVVAVIMVIVMLFAGGEIRSSSGSSYTRECAKSGCDRPAATSGDTVYCTTHSSHCLNCGCYVDADAMFCMRCLRNALD